MRLAILILLSACAVHTAEKPKAPVPADNFVVRWVTAQQPKASCDLYYNDAGTEHAYSAKCDLPNGASFYCTVDAAHPFACTCVAGPCMTQQPPTPAPKEEPKSEAPKSEAKPEPSKPEPKKK